MSMIAEEQPIREKRFAKKQYFNRYLTMYQHEVSKRGIMVRSMIHNIDFPIRKKPYYYGLDYFIENGFDEFAETYRTEFEKFRRLDNTNTVEIKIKCSQIRNFGTKRYALLP